MMLERLLLLFPLLLLCSPSGAAETSSSGEKRLFDELFANYSAEVRPRRDSKQSVVVTVELVLNHIKQLDEHAEVLYTSTIIHSEWMDEYLTWEPQEYDGVQELVLSPQRIWLPDIGVDNSASKFFDEDFFQLFRVHVYHTGRVRWWYGGVMETSCHLDGTLFPFDSQSCSIVVQSWAHSEAFVDVRNGSGHVHLEKFNDDDIWKMIGSSARRHRTTSVISARTIYYPQVEFTIYLDRKPLYYIVNIIVPVFFLVLVVLMVYWLPPDSGDKISLSITVLLSFSVLLFVVSDSIPPSSEHTPVLSVFVTVTMAVSTASVIEAIIVMRLCSLQSTTMPSVVRLVAFRLVGRVLGVSRPSSPPSTDQRRHRGAGETGRQEEPDAKESLLGDTEMSSVTRDASELVGAAKSLLAELRKITAHQEKNAEESKMADEWRELGNVIDRLLFVVSLVIFVCVTLWMVVKSAQTPRVHDIPSFHHSGH